MRRRNGDHDARLADLDPAEAMVDRDLAEVVLRFQLRAEPDEHRLGHLLERLVLEIHDVPSARAAANCADECRDRSRVLARDLVDGRLEVERLAGEPEGAAGHRRDERHLVTVVQRVVGSRVLAVDRVEQSGRLLAEPQLRPDVADPRDVRDLGVIQALFSNQVGQRVIHDLRAAVFRHLQRLSLAFFTRTRTGEVQSRISNDIGGVQGVVTNTATSIASNITTVVATMIGMLLLNWELALFAFALIPFFVVLTRRVGDERRKIAKTTQETLADISSLVQESLSVSGILLGKTMGRTNELADRFEADSLRLADLEVRQRMAGRWVMATIQTSFSVMPAAVYWFGGVSHVVGIATIVAFTTLQTRLFFPVGSLLGVGLDVQTSLALFDRIFEYLDQSIDIEEKPDALAVAQAGDVAFDQVWFRYGDDAWTLEDVSFTVAAGSTTALVGETGSGKTTLGYLAARLYDVRRGAITIGGVAACQPSFRALRELRLA